MARMMREQEQEQVRQALEEVGLSPARAREQGVMRAEGRLPRDVGGPRSSLVAVTEPELAVLLLGLLQTHKVRCAVFGEMLAPLYAELAVKLQELDQDAGSMAMTNDMITKHADALVAKLSRTLWPEPVDGPDPRD